MGRQKTPPKHVKVCETYLYYLSEKKATVTPRLTYSCICCTNKVDRKRCSTDFKRGTPHRRWVWSWSSSLYTCCPWEIQSSCIHFHCSADDMQLYVSMKTDETEPLAKLQASLKDLDVHQCFSFKFELERPNLNSNCNIQNSTSNLKIKLKCQLRISISISSVNLKN